jgi:hypothetical protein
MARINGITKRLVQLGFDTLAIKTIVGSGNLVNAISQMDKRLAPEVMHDILDSCACTGGKDFLKRCETIGKEMAGMTLAEKIDYINSISSEDESIVLNDDGTLTVRWAFASGEKHKCVCSAAVKNGLRVAQLAEDADGSMPLSYCYCCAGSARRHLQLQLGISLKTKEIITSPINSSGEKPCKFILEVVPGDKIRNRV